MSDTHKSSGLSFTSLLTLIFILCKLTGFITWSWWWVLSPILIGTAVGVFILALVAIIMIAAAVLK